MCHQEASGAIFVKVFMLLLTRDPMFWFTETHQISKYRHTFIGQHVLLATSGPLALSVWPAMPPLSVCFSEPVSLKDVGRVGWLFKGSLTTWQGKMHVFYMAGSHHCVAQVVCRKKVPHTVHFFSEQCSMRQSTTSHHIDASNRLNMIQLIWLSYFMELR